jgi:hypothetical protein
MSCRWLAGLIGVLAAVGAVPAGDPLADPADPFRLDKELAMFRAIRDDARFPWTITGPRDESLRADDDLEAAAFDEVLRFARRFPAAELEAHARRDVAFRDLMQPARASFKLEPVYLEGRLRRLRRADRDAALKEAGATGVYEAWVFPKGEDTPLCAFVTELPPGLHPQADLSAPAPDHWVAVAGYSFKLLRYESAEREPGAADRRRVRRAPVLIGRTLRVVAEPADPGEVGREWRTTFLPMVFGGFTAVGLLLAGAAWWFRRGDRAARAEIAAARDRNPFDQ